MLVLAVAWLAFAEEGAAFDMDEPSAGATATEPAATDPNARDMDSGTGELAPSAISSVLKKNEWAIQDCVSRLGGAGFSGRIVVEWEILATGAAANVKTSETSIKNPPFEACLLSAVRRMKFGAPTGGTVITKHPFVFQL